MSNPTADQKTYSVFKDGAAWCATVNGFINLQESLAGFGALPAIALGALIIAENEAELERWKTIRKWICNCCTTVFSRRHAGDGRTPNSSHRQFRLPASRRTNRPSHHEVRTWLKSSTVLKMM